jgi:leucyl-tRNA synthetase
MTEELWEIYYAGTGRAYQQKWPEFDEAKTVEATVEIAVQINGKVKAQLMVELDEDEASVKEKAHAIPAIASLMEGKNVVKEIYVKGRILNIVVK